MKTLPDCPHCDADATLSAVRVEVRGVVVAECSCCGKTCRVRDGTVVHVPDRRDINGTMMYDEGEY